MADHPTFDVPVPREAITESVGESYWSVDDCQWANVRPELPEELIELLAPPITVGAAPIRAVAPAPRPGVGTPTALDRLAVLLDARAPVIAPAPSRARRRRHAGRAGRPR